MQNDMMNYFNETSQTALNSANELIELNTRVLNKTIEHQLQLSNIFVESSQKQAGLLQFTTDPAEFLDSQVKLTEQYTAIFVEAAKENVTFARKTTDDYQGWFDKNIGSTDLVIQKPNATVKKSVSKRKVS